MPKPVDLAGREFGRLTVIGLAPREACPVSPSTGWRLRSWMCRCECGTVLDHAIPTARLVARAVKSCGCLQREKASASGKRRAAIRIRKACPHCLADFDGTPKQIFCGRECKEGFGLVARQGWQCEACGRPINARRGQRYCSEACKRRGRSRPPLSPGSVVSSTAKILEKSHEQTQG